MASSVHVFPAPSVRPSPVGKHRVDCVIGLDAVRDRLSNLQPIVQGTLQQYELLDVPYFLSRPQRLRTTPHLLLIHAGPRQTLVGGVLLLEFQNMYLSLDGKGRRSVFAPPEQRVDLAAIAAQFLLKRGARLVHIDVDTAAPYDASASLRAMQKDVQGIAEARLGGFGNSISWCVEPGVAYTHMPLQRSFDATLAPLGRKARKNLRRYRRLATRDLACRFEPDARLRLDEFTDLARASHYGVSTRDIVWRHRSMDAFPNTFCCGLQTPSGKWLAVAGCRRNGPTIEIDWQMNRKGFEAYSLVTALRSAFIEHECAAGSTRLAVDSGELHQMAETFPRNIIYNVTARRPSLLVDALGLLLPRLYPLHVVTAALSRSQGCVRGG